MPVSGQTNRIPSITVRQTQCPILCTVIDRIIDHLQLYDFQRSRKVKTTFETRRTTSNVVSLRSYVSISACGTVFAVCANGALRTAKHSQFIPSRLLMNTWSHLRITGMKHVFLRMSTMPGNVIGRSRRYIKTGLHDSEKAIFAVYVSELAG